MFETTRLILKMVAASDLDMYLKMYKCPETTRYLPLGKQYTEEQIEEIIEKRVAHWDWEFGTFTIIEKATCQKIGYVGVEKSPAANISDIRYGIESSARGKNYALEAATECLRYTFNQGFHEKIYGASVYKNQASINVMQRLGMTAEPHIDFYDAPDLLYFSTSRERFYKTFNGND